MREKNVRVVTTTGDERWRSDSGTSASYLLGLETPLTIGAKLLIKSL